jgi:hypothetical protein
LLRDLRRLHTNDRASGHRAEHRKSGRHDRLAELKQYAAIIARGGRLICVNDSALALIILKASTMEDATMRLSIALSALLTTGLVAGFVAASTEKASAVVYCQYVAYPVGCVVRPGVVLRPRPVARAVVTPGVGVRGTPMNRGGPVNRVGRR